MDGGTLAGRGAECSRFTRAVGSQSHSCHAAVSCAAPGVHGSIQLSYSALCRQGQEEAGLLVGGHSAPNPP